MLLEYLKNGNEDYAIVLLKGKASIDADDLLKSLSYACFNDLKTIVGLILDRGVTRKSDTNIAMPPLLCAIEQGNVAMTKMLIDRGFDINEFTSGSTPLHYAVEIACDAEQQMMMVPETLLQVIRLLIISGSDLEALDYVGRTPADIAKFYKSPVVSNAIQSSLQSRATN